MTTDDRVPATVALSRRSAATLLAALEVPGVNVGDLVPDPDLLQEAIDELSLVIDVGATPVDDMLAWLPFRNSLLSLERQAAALHPVEVDTVTAVAQHLDHTYRALGVDLNTGTAARSSLMTAYAMADLATRYSASGRLTPGEASAVRAMAGTTQAALIRFAPIEART